MEHTDVYWEREIDSKDWLVNTNYKETWVPGVTTEVDLSGIDSDSNVGNTYTCPPQNWRHNCATVVTLTHIVYCKLHEMKSSR
jgi:hypothetical protein